MPTTRIPRLTVFCPILLAAAWAQTTGSIEGTVADPAQLAIANATVKVTERQTGVATSTTTDSSGYYLFQNLAGGTYDIAVNQQGFKAYLSKDHKLDIASRVRRDVTLEVGSLAESVTVQANAVEVETSNGTVSAVITREQIATAVLNGRNYSRLAMLVPGAVYQSGADELSGAGQTASGSPVSINGLSATSQGWFVDGAYDVNVGSGSANTHIPVIDSLEEVQVQTSNYSARYGTTGGAIISAVTRGGTSVFHGSAYEYLRNSAMDARNFFSPAPTPLKQNQFGFTIGGPVILPHYNKNRNKTFFFYSEDWRNRSNPSVSQTSTPTDAMRTGDFTAEASRLNLPLLDPSANQPFPSNRIPANRINPNAALLVKTYFPPPNNPGGGFLNYLNNGVATLSPRTDTGRLDHNLNDNFRLSFTIAYDDVRTLQSNLNSGSFLFPSIRQREATTGLNGNVRASYTFSPHTTNEGSFAYKTYNVNLFMKDDLAPQVRPAGLTMREFFQGANTLNLAPGLTFSGGWSSAGTSQWPLSPATDSNYIITDNFSHIAGKHTLQFGGTWFHYFKTQAINNATQGTYSFSGTFTNHPVADFMLGLGRSYTEGKERFIRSYALEQTEWYAQDDWRVSRKLTVNLGLRVFVMPPVHEVQDRVDSFLPGKYDSSKAPTITSAGVLLPTPNYDPTNGLVFAGKNGVPRGFANNYVGWGPRFGFAFDPVGNGKMAIRGGYGVSFLNLGNDLNSDGLNTNPPFSQNVNLQNVSLDDPTNGTPNALAPVSLGAFNPNFKRPMVQSWSLTAQRELPGELLASIGYVGTRGTNFETWMDVNSPAFIAPPGVQFDTRINGGANTNLLRPYQGYTAITQVNSGYSSIYHSLQATARRRFSHGLALQGAYTFAKAMGQTSSNRVPMAQNPLNWRGDFGLVDFDRKQVFSMNYVYALPFLRGRRDIAGRILGGWELSGFLTLQSGLAISPAISTGRQGLASRPDATGIATAGPRTLAQWFDIKAFAAPAPGFYGNAGTGTIRGPGFAIWDSSLSKQFAITERVRFRLGGEFFNSLNHTNFSGLTPTLGSGTFGRITSARDPRKVQINARLEF